VGGAPELGRAAGTAWKAAGTGRQVLLRVYSVIIIISMISTVFMGIGGDEQVARSMASPQSPFTAPVRINSNTANDQSLPALAELPDGKLVVAWQDAQSGLDNDDIYVAGSDNGTTYTPGVRADDSTVVSKQIDPAIAVSGSGTVYLVWQDNRKSKFENDIYFTKSTDGGATFTKNVKVDDSAGNLSWQERPSIAVTSNGVIYVAWTDDREGATHMRIRGAYSTDGGATFSASSKIVPTGTTGQDMVSLAFSGNRLFAAFTENLTGVPHAYICTSTNGGKSFSAPVRLDGGTDNATQSEVCIAPMAGGGVVAVWKDSRNGYWNIYASIVSSHGAVTQSNIRVDDDSTMAFQSDPTIAADALGNLYAAWRDERDGGSSAIRFAYLEAGNTSFCSSMEVNRPGPNDMQRKPSIVVTDPGRVVVAYQDDKSGVAYDVYSSTAFFPGLFGLSFVRGWNLISIPSDGYVYKASTLGLKKGDVVASWNSTLQVFDKSYVVGGSPPPMDFVLAPSTGYWVSASSPERIKLNGTVPTSPQSKTLTVPQGGGWIMIGFESLSTTRYASDIPKMHDVPGGVTTVSGYDAVTRTYETYINGLPMSDFVLTPGEAYYCWCTVSGTLTYVP